jgi:hypothetical protein
MEISADPLAWTTLDSDSLAKFLDTETGKRLVPKLADATPPLFDRGDTNALLIRTGEVRGVQIVLREILMLAHPPPPVPSSANSDYPSPEDDSKWDGPKIHDPNPQLL